MRNRSAPTGRVSGADGVPAQSLGDQRAQQIHGVSGGQIADVPCVAGDLGGEPGQEEATSAAGPSSGRRDAVAMRFRSDSRTPSAWRGTEKTCIRKGSAKPRS